METTRLHVLIEGWVQGVGFRYSTLAKAESLRLNGWVRNLPDGRVEAEFEGPRDTLETMLAWCRRGPLGASVRRVEEQWANGEPRYQRFSILY
ncbi:MAG TPA: acylphosphatase [Candidatus Hydrogenedentes bacterium]|nr:acylphosphatase [Candidatus Hydrogenedentota bacterium]